MSRWEMVPRNEGGRARLRAYRTKHGVTVEIKHDPTVFIGPEVVLDDGDENILFVRPEVHRPFPAMAFYKTGGVWCNRWFTLRGIEE